jgi:hypothetical protein
MTWWPEFLLGFAIGAGPAVIAGLWAWWYLNHE